MREHIDIGLRIVVEDDRTGMDPVVLQRAFLDHVRFSAGKVAVISVSIKPSARALTRTPIRPTSLAIAFVNVTRPPFALA